MLLETVRSRLVYRSLDAVVTAPLRPRRSVARYVGSMLSPRGSNYDRVGTLVNLVDAVLPGTARRAGKLICRPVEMPFPAQRVELLAYGSGATVFLVHSGSSRRVVKIYRRSLGVGPRRLAELVAWFRDKYDCIRSWYEEVVGLVWPSEFVLLPGPILGRPAVACVQQYIDQEPTDFFRCLAEGRLEASLEQSDELRRQVAGFAERTLHVCRTLRRCPDFLGRNNLSIVGRGHEQRLRLIDYGIFDLDAAGRTPAVRGQLDRCLEQIRGLLRPALVAAVVATVPHVVQADPPASRQVDGIWTSADELASLPMSGPAWNSLKAAADTPAGLPRINDLNDPTDVRVMAKALVYARTGEPRYRDEVIAACLAASGTEEGGRTLALGRNLVAYVIAADLVGLPTDDDLAFRSWLRAVLTRQLKGKTLISTNEDRPNNWGTHAGASRAAVAAYLDDATELKRVAAVFKGWLGDRSSYDGFRYRDLWWQADPEHPVGINPMGAEKPFGGVNRSIDGVIPDDQRRGGPFRWPPPRERYTWEALQGAIAQAVILHRAGYDVWNWQDKALLRAVTWLHEQADYPAEGDDTWQPHVINHFYGTSFPAPVPARPGKNVGWTDWTLGARP